MKDTKLKYEDSVCEFIKDYTDTRGYAPTFGEIQEHCNIPSKATVYTTLRRLRSRGRVQWAMVEGQVASRTIRVLGEDDGVRADNQ